MRRQNRSCDQCRKAKRACDAPSLRETLRRVPPPASSRNDAVLRDALDVVCVPCSYCVRTNKQCTLNWARSQLQVAEATLASRPTNGRRSKRSRAGSSIDAGRAGFYTSGQLPFAHDHPATTTDPAVIGHLARLWDADQQSFPGLSALDPLTTIPDACSYMDDSHDLASVGLDNPAALFHLSHPADLTIHISSTQSQQPHFAPVSSDHPSLWEMMPPPTDHDRPPGPAIVGFSPSPHICASSIFSSVSLPTSPSVSGTQDSQTQYEASRSGLLQPRCSHRPSAFSSMVPYLPPPLEQHLASRSNSQNISENLLQIYHDVLEHNLSCWITEATCPYRIGDGQRPTPKEMGAQWSNRIYHRVGRLDYMARTVGLIHVTHDQAQASQKALNLVIMAFATQWAQGSRRQRETYSASFADRDGVPGTGVRTAAAMPADEFDRSLQRLLWEQARQALQDCADIESYGMVCAELIFSMVQRPWEPDMRISCLQDDEAGQSEPTSILSALATIFAKDGPPIFSERAARKIHGLKYRFDCHEARRKQGLDDRLTSSHAPGPTEEGDTVRLLYWLAVIIDTIHASVHERPVVLGDEDSQHDAAVLEDEHRLTASDPPPPADNRSIVLPLRGNSHAAATAATAAAASTTSSSRWRIHLFLQDDPGRETPPPQHQWPCSYEEAGMAIIRSTPVKVLLYRYVHYLQKTLRSWRGGPASVAAAAVEDTIHDTLVVYRYWNVTYAPFYRDIVAHYASVPPRIRGWTVCIDAHWHLGALLFADTLEDVDARRCGLEDARARRRAAGTVTSIRRSSASQLADLARMATPSSLDGPTGFEAGHPNFHFAVREGTILTEPWTIMLIRAFSKAAFLHLQDMRALQQQYQHQSSSAGESDARQRCEDCVHALWLLGKKSDMARCVAAVLSRAMRETGALF